VELRGVSKRFYYYEHRTNTLREWFIRRILHRPLNVRRAEFTLRNFDLRVERGEAVALIGSNGSGKSTALRLIAGIYGPSSGTIRTYGRLTAVIELGAGFHPELTGADNVALYAAVLGLGRKQLAARYDEIVDFAETRDFMDTPLKYYSSGMEARLAFAVAVCLEPDVLLLDEPLSNLDARLRVQTRSLLRSLVKRLGITTLCVTHDQEEALAFSDQIAVIRNGRILQSGPPKAIYDKPGDIDVANFLGEMNFFAATSDGLDQQGRLRFRSQFGLVSLSPGALVPEVKPSSPVSLTIRPHHVVLKAPAGAPMQNCFEGQVETVEFLGSRRRCTVRLGAATCIVELHNASFHEGSAVVIEFPEEFLGVIAREP